MLLGNRKKQGEEQNWCIVLNPLRSPIDKRKVAQKISEVFSLTVEEAADLVSNTPIILLDNLTRQVASQVKDFFSTTGAEMILTNDVFLKRKCYRTVWPEPPNLSFLHDWKDDSERNGLDEQEKLDAGEALEEIRSLSSIDEIRDKPEPVVAQNSQPSQPLTPSAPAEPPFSSDAGSAEADHWRRENARAREEIARLSNELEQAREDRYLNESDHEASSEIVTRKENEIRELRAMLANVEEKFESLKDEYQQARTLYEEKFTERNQAAEKDIRKSHELQAKVNALESIKAELETQLQQVRDDAQGVREEAGVHVQEIDRLKRRVSEAEGLTEVSRRASDGRIKDLETEREALSEQNGQLLRRLEELEQEKKASTVLLEERLIQSEQQFRDEQEKLNQSLARVRDLEFVREETQKTILALKEEKVSLSDTLREKAAEMEGRLAATAREKEMLQTRLAEGENRLRSSREESEQFRRELQEQVSAASSWQDKYNALVRNQNLINAQLNDEKLKTEKSEQLQKELEKSQTRLIQELEERSKKLNHFEEAMHELEQRTQGLQSQIETQNSLVSDTQRHLESRERELESTKRQLREATTQMEHREAAQKRIQLSQQLAEKENSLKHMVEEQTNVETEIRQREEKLRELLARQELLEKEVVENKQAQRHLTEQAKKERTSRVRSHARPSLREPVQEDVPVTPDESHD